MAIITKCRIYKASQTNIEKEYLINYLASFNFPVKTKLILTMPDGLKALEEVTLEVFKFEMLPHLALSCNSAYMKSLSLQDRAMKRYYFLTGQ
jgi:hypothetical protein